MLQRLLGLLILMPISNALSLIVNLFQDIVRQEILRPLIRAISCSLLLLELLLHKLLLGIDRLLNLLDSTLDLDFHVWEVELLGNQLAVPALQDHDVFALVVGLLVHDAGYFVGVLFGRARSDARELAGWVHQSGGVGFVESPRGDRRGLLVLEEEFEVL
jgi:hypothetical protein